LGGLGGAVGGDVTVETADGPFIFMVIVVWNISKFPLMGLPFQTTCTTRLQLPPVAGAVTVFTAGLAGAVDRISELFGGNMLTIT
jgi:hypothetical protein